MDKARTLQLLNEDIAQEHGRLLDLLLLAFSGLTPGFAGALEGMSREEMLHFKWLSLAVAALGGEPTLARPATPFPTGAVAGLERLATSGRALAEQCRRQAATIQAPSIVRLLERIIDDLAFQCARLDELAAAAAAEPAPAAGTALAPDTVALLRRDASDQYTAVLQYLHHSFIMRDQRLGRIFEDLAIQEMRHLGPLNEAIAELGGEPRFESGQIDLSAHLDAVLQANITDERGAQAQYQAHADATADDDIKTMLLRFKRQEAEHEGILTDLLKEEQRPARTRATVGSLKNTP